MATPVVGDDEELELATMPCTCVAEPQRFVGGEGALPEEEERMWDPARPFLSSAFGPVGMGRRSEGNLVALGPVGIGGETAGVLTAGVAVTGLKVPLTPVAA